MKERLAAPLPETCGTGFATLLLAVLPLTACTSFAPDPHQHPYQLSKIPAADTYCLEAQRVITRTTIPMQLVVHDDFDAFVKSKAVIEGPVIHQYNWHNAKGELTGISCKMKSADHLNIEFGAGSAGPDSLCHDMNRQVYALLASQIPNPVYDPVVFDLSESLDTKEQANMIGPVWLMPFTMTEVDDSGGLHVATKGFVIDFNDPRYQKFPPSWRGTHYCHLISPDYLAGLMQGDAAPGAVVGRVDKMMQLPKR